MWTGIFFFFYFPPRPQPVLMFNGLKANVLSGKPIKDVDFFFRVGHTQLAQRPQLLNINASQWPLCL